MEEKILNPQEVKEDYSSRHIISFMVGVYLAMNAIRDAYLLVEGPDCTYMKSLYIQGNQDYLSTLTSVSGFHRIANTALHPAMMASSREDVIKSLLLKMAEHKETGGVMFTSMPMAFMTGADYERICRDVAKTTGKQVIHIPGKSLSNDWLGGYEETIYSLAGQLTIEKVNPDENNVAIIGLLFERNEEDSKGNVRELKRLLAGLGLNVVSIWLEGQNFSELDMVKEAGAIISFPYGRRAGKILSKRLGVKLIESELPFGLSATERWLRQLAKHFNCEDKAEKFIEKELKNVVPKLEWVIPFLFQHHSFGYIGDPYLLPGFIEIIELIGGFVRFAIITNCKYHLKGANYNDKIDRVLVEEKINTLQEFSNEYIRDNRIDCIVTNNTGLTFTNPNKNAIIEFGFPSYDVHALYDRPYIGFNGFLAFIDSMANKMRTLGTYSTMFNP